MENPTLQLTIAFISVFIFAITKQGFYFQILREDIAPLIFLGLINTGLGCLEPLSAVFFSFIFLKEILSPVQLLGAAFIIGGAVVSDIRK